VPALLYAALAVRGGGEALRGWGVPVATDIAFALGILALLGPRVPVQLRVFLMALATVDDIGGILIIAVFYTSTISWTALAVGLLIAAALFAMRWIRPVNAGIYGLLGVLLWLAFLKSGIHATIAGVVFGLSAPAKRFYSLTEVEETSEIMDRELRAAIEAGDEERADLFLGQLEEMAKSSEQPARRLERFVRPWVSYVVLPIFSLANAGIELSWPGLKAACLDPVGQAITAGLLVGKPIGIVLFTLLAVRLGWSRLPEQVRTSHLIGTGILAGIGFTVSLFIAGLAFEGPHLDVAKLAVLGVSVLAATAGGGFLYLASARGTAAGSTAA
jgi:NhaA family Na+:H+ antiporter